MKKIILGFLFILIFLLSLNGFLLWRFYRWLQPPVGQTNFLVLGVAGENHKGGDLTDTMIFVSIDNQTGKALFLSLPRDIWVALLKTKLNSIYHYEGLGKTKSLVGQILGQKIDYGVLVDFNLFTQIIDELDGVKIEVERSLDDYRYPILGKENDLCNGDLNYQCRYESLHFEAGPQIMSGERALKFVRSRFAQGEEGTDFARLKRQQKVILAVRQKIFSAKFIFSRQRILRLIGVVKNNIKSDIFPDDYLKLAKISLKLRTKNLRMEVLNDGYLVRPPNLAPYDNQWVLIPKLGDWEEIQKYVSVLIEDLKVD